MIRHLIYDFGKVLVDYDFSGLLNSFFDNQSERDAFNEIFTSIEYCNKVDKGDLDFDEVMDEYCAKYPQWSPQIKEFGERQLDAVTGEVAGMKELLTRLKAKGYSLWGLSNWSATVYPVLEKFEIFRLLDGRVISSEEQLIKPSPEIYRRLCEKYSLKEEECLFTDDREININGSLAAGIDAVLFKDASQYEAELVRRGIL